MNKIIFFILIICNIHYTFEYYDDKDMVISTGTSRYTRDNKLTCFITYDEGNEEDKVVCRFIKISIS